MSRACNFDLSPCCQENVVVAGEGMTHWYACAKCHQPVPDDAFSIAYRKGQEDMKERCIQEVRHQEMANVLRQIPICRWPGCSCESDRDCE